MLIAEILREAAFHAIEALVHSRARRVMGVGCRFGDDSLGYFTERLDPTVTRQALGCCLRRAKRNKAFDNSPRIGFALDGTAAARSVKARCPLCRPIVKEDGATAGHHHNFSLISVVGTTIVLPFDVEPYGPCDSEQAASQRLLVRAVEQMGGRFADYVVADGLYATAPFLHAAGELGLKCVVRLKGNLRQLLAEAEARFGMCEPSTSFQAGEDRVEIWDAGDFDPWEALNWTTVRVLRYRQCKPNGEIVEAYWLTNFTHEETGSRALYAMAKSRWQIENEVFNEGKNQHGMKRIRHHHENSLLLGWLLLCLAIVIERLYRLRYLHRGARPVGDPIDLVRRLWLSLGASRFTDTG